MVFGHMIAPEARLIGGLHEADALLKRHRHGAVSHFDRVENAEFHSLIPDDASRILWPLSCGGH